MKHIYSFIHYTEGLLNRKSGGNMSQTITKTAGGGIIRHHMVNTTKLGFRVQTSCNFII